MEHFFCSVCLFLCNAWKFLVDGLQFWSLLLYFLTCWRIHYSFYWWLSFFFFFFFTDVVSCETYFRLEIFQSPSACFFFFLYFIATNDLKRWEQKETKNKCWTFVIFFFFVINVVPQSLTFRIKNVTNPV